MCQFANITVTCLKIVLHILKIILTGLSFLFNYFLNIEVRIQRHRIFLPNELRKTSLFLIAWIASEESTMNYSHGEKKEQLINAFLSCSLSTCAVHLPMK